MGTGAVNKERNIILVLDTFSLGDEKGEGFQHADFLFLLWGEGRAHVTGDTTATASLLLPCGLQFHFSHKWAILSVV